MDALFALYCVETDPSLINITIRDTSQLTHIVNQRITFFTLSTLLIIGTASDKAVLDCVDAGSSVLIDDIRRRAPFAFDNAFKRVADIKIQSVSDAVLDIVGFSQQVTHKLEGGYVLRYIR